MLDHKSKVENLNLYDYKINISSSISTLTEQFKANPNIPGVILFEDDTFLGAISQKSFWQYMSRPYSLELCAKRNVEHLLNFFEINHLVLSKNHLIIEAAEISLQRSPDLLEQPIVVKMTPLEYKLLDTHQLLVSYAAIHQLTNRMLARANKKLEETNLKLKQTLRSDEITGLGNELLFKEYFAREWQRSVKEQNWLSLIRFDLDIFQETRNSYTQLNINGCLRKIGETIEPLLNRVKDLIVHYGEGRFAIVLPSSNTIDATLIGEKTSDAIQKFIITNSRTQISKNLSLNLGIASIKPRDQDESEQLLIAAEESLEKAKIMGKNCKIITDISYSELKTQSKLPTLNRKEIRPKFRPPIIPLNSDRVAKKASSAVDRPTLVIWDTLETG